MPPAAMGGDRTGSVREVQPVQVEKQSHDYRRDGTTTPFISLEVATGKITDARYERHCGVEFLKFLKVIAKAYRRRQPHRRDTTTRDSACLDSCSAPIGVIGDHAARDMSELLERLGFELTDTLGRQSKVLGNVPETAARPAVIEAVAHLKDDTLARCERAQLPLEGVNVGGVNEVA